MSDGGAAITDYLVQISGDAGKTWATVADGVSPATTATVTGLTNSTSYRFRVAAVNAAGTGTSFARSAALTPRTLPQAPGGVVAVPGDGRVSLTWSAPASNGGATISDYVIHYSSDTGVTWATFADRVSATPAATVTGLTNGTSYVFRVAAVNAAGTGAASVESAAVTPRKLLGAPTGLVGTPADGRVGLSWAARVSDGGAAITDYLVQISGDGGSTWATVDDGISPATTATVTGLTNGASYIFRVAAVNAAGTGTRSASSAAFVPAPFGGFSEFSAPQQMVTGSADMFSGRVFDPTGTAVDAIHVYRDLNGNGVLDLTIDQLLHADPTPADGYAFNAGSLPSGTHVLHIAAIKNGMVVGSSTNTVVAALWWSVSIGSRNHGTAGFPTEGEQVAAPTPFELTPGPDGGNWKDAVRHRVTGTVYTANLVTHERHVYTFTPTAEAFAIGTQRELTAQFRPRRSLDVPAATKMIGLEDLFFSTNPVSDEDYDDQYWFVTMTPVLVDLDVDSDNTGNLDHSAHEDDIEEGTNDEGVIVLPGVIVPVGGDRVKMTADVPEGMTATLAFAEGVDMVRVYDQQTSQPGQEEKPVLSKDKKTTTVVGGSRQTFWIEAFATSESMADIAFTLTLNVSTGSGSTGSASSDTIRATAVEVDLDVDSDNVGGVQRSAIEDAIEDIAGIDATPGLYLQVQDEDSDGDGLVNWADGFNGLGDELAIDDVSAGATFAPLWFEIPELVYAPDATLEISYSASEPSAAVMDPHYLSWDRPTDGHLRIWTKDAFLPRNRKPVQEGGDYVAPTTRTPRRYTLAELGLQPGANLLFLEAIRESTTTAQQEITFRLTPRFGGQPAPFTLADTVRVTTARIEVLADNRDGTPAFSTFSLTATPMPNPNAGLSGLVPDITQAYTINVYDPRGPQTIHATYVAGTRLPLVQSGTARYTTPQFLAVPQEDLPLIAGDLPVEGLLDGPLHPSDVIGQAIFVPVSGAVVQIQYNGNATASRISVKQVEAADKLFWQVAEQVAKDMTGFTVDNNDGKNVGGNHNGVPGRYNPRFGGAYGHEFEARVHKKFQALAAEGNAFAERFKKGFVVDAGRRLVDGAPDGSTQIDVLFLRKGYNPKVGDGLDPKQVIVFEVKTSASGNPNRDQLKRLSELSELELRSIHSSWRFVADGLGSFKVAPNTRFKAWVRAWKGFGSYVLTHTPEILMGTTVVVRAMSAEAAEREDVLLGELEAAFIKADSLRSKVGEFELQKTVVWEKIDAILENRGMELPPLAKHRVLQEVLAP